MPVVTTLPSSTMNMTGFRTCERGSSLGNESPDRGEHELAREDAAACAGHRLLPSELVESEIELEDVHAGLAEEAEAAPVRVVADQLLHRRERQVADRGDAARLQCGVRRRDVRVDPGAPTS